MFNMRYQLVVFSDFWNFEGLPNLLEPLNHLFESIKENLNQQLSTSYAAGLLTVYAFAFASHK